MNTEQMILEAAEKLFIEKGYAGTKCMEIAEAAGVNHAMLHYYFRTKDSLFNQIFEQKASQLLGFFSKAFAGDLPFFEKLKIGIEKHFDFLAESPGLPLFVFREVIQNSERKKYFREKIMSTGMSIFEQVEKTIQEEVNRGHIRPMRAVDLMLNIGSLNVFTFIVAQAAFDIQKDIPNPAYANFLEERKKNNVEVIINSLKI